MNSRFKINPKTFILRALAVIFLIIYVVRITLVADSFNEVIRGISPDFSTVQAIFMSLLRWVTYAAALIVIISTFSKSRNQRNLILFFALPVAVLNLIFIGANTTAMIGANHSGFSIAMLGFIFEQALTIIIALYIVVIIGHKTGLLIETKKTILALLASIGGILLCAIPIWLPQQLFGRTDITVSFATIGHHIWVGLTIAIWIGLYFFLRNKSMHYKFYVLMFICMATFINYFSFYHLDSLTPARWPLHLCNLATVLMPITLLTRNRFLFPFLYFANVTGALIAIFIPDLSNPLLSVQTMRFAHAHTMAFILPILFVSLGLFPRQKFRDLKVAFVGFAIYFVVVVFGNVIITNFDNTVQFFFLNGDFLSSRIFFLYHAQQVVISIPIGGITLDFYILFYLIVFAAFIGFMSIAYFIYLRSYIYGDEAEQIKNNKIQKRLDRTRLLEDMNGREITEPVNKIGGIMLKITNFSKTYASAKKPAVENFNLEVKEGEVFGFLGLNGAGKSTTIKSVVGILPFTEGTIEVNGFDISRQPLEAKKLIGYVPDNHAVYEKLTGRQYVNFIADIYGVSQEDRDKRVVEILEKFKLEASFDNLIKTYSHGMKQKITIIAALVHCPKLWVLDEPLTGLDPQSAFEVKEYMQEHARSGNTVFFSSHIIDVVEKICDRVAIISGGKLVGVYDMKEFAKTGQSLEKVFLENSVLNTSVPEKKVKKQKIAKEEKPSADKPNKKSFNPFNRTKSEKTTDQGGEK